MNSRLRELARDVGMGRSNLELSLLPTPGWQGVSSIVPKVFVVREAKATTSIQLYKCFTA